VDTELSLMDGVAHQSGAYEYYLLSDGSAAITFYSDSTADIIEIPSEIDGYKITAIGSECFVWLPSLVTVTVPDGVTYIGAMAFEGCGNLFNLRLPESIASIGDNAFKGCSTEMSVEYEGDISKVRLGSGNSALISSLEIGK